MTGQTHFDDPRWDVDQTALDDHTDDDAEAEEPRGDASER